MGKINVNRISKLFWVIVIQGVCLGAPTFAASPVINDQNIAMEYRAYLKKKVNKAFAYNGQKSFSYSYHAISIEWAEKMALETCELSRKSKNKKNLNRPGNENPCAIVHSEAGIFVPTKQQSDY